ncbi:DgyrCDS2523 [Dimorphilus gyrociliatus]|uniref:DgyrCDS2523 n=1 Tax=Dimorphilus gyrociliatus TaxID=2664684 RepID=A0A7I8VBV1_9ANNE|nr:DgyrCDS2523 [Dimorphilus gyrociliatus]
MAVNDFWDAPGRITGSSSIDTLVRVGLEKEKGLKPERNMIVLQDFSPCGPDEVRVNKGQFVNVLYTERNWVYVITDHGAEGFIPINYCAPRKQYPLMAHTEALCGVRSPTSSGEGFGSPLSLQRSASLPSITDNQVYDQQANSVYQNEDVIEEWKSRHARNVAAHQEEVFEKKNYGTHRVLYNYRINYENDVQVMIGDTVLVLNIDDPDWFWVQRKDKEEGFVPASYLSPDPSARFSSGSDEYVRLKRENSEEDNLYHCRLVTVS